MTQDVHFNACDSDFQDVFLTGTDSEILDALGFGVVIIESSSHKIAYANEKLCAVSGYSKADIQGQVCHSLLCPADVGKCPITDFGLTVDNSERILLNKAGEKISIIKNVVPFKAGEKDYLIESIIDNTERKKVSEQLHETNDLLRKEIKEREKIEQKITHLAYHDSLTGLPNRLLFVDRLKQAIALSRRIEIPFGVLFLDMDDFKLINDTLGHDQGDALLKAVSKRLAGAIRKEDTVSRLGGDEFILIAQNLKGEDAIITVAERVLDCFKTPFKLNSNDFYINASIGVALFPADGEDSETLIKNADIAMYRAKGNGKNQYSLCTDVMKSSIQEKLGLTNRLYGALERDELMLYYQPQVCCATGKIIGLEALLRWNNPELGFVPPSKFIPLAEQTGLIIPIGEWVLRTACKQAKAWQYKHGKPLRMAVNLSLYQMKNPDLASTIKSILDETGLDPKSLELEITESIAMNAEHGIIDGIKAFKELGVQISIDDFGTEYSSLNRLKEMPIDRIKIAMPFIQGILQSEKDEAITKAIIVLAKNLGLHTLAEGVEDINQVAFLNQSMCDEIQGFYYYHPLPSDEIEAILAADGVLERADESDCARSC
jgi:diguanylate cyclase (GGDEF)-like protein/PAS domain S-box-containing protein